MRGPIDAPVTVVEYGDFECPYCGQAEPVVRELLSEFGDVAYVWRHLPLSDVHPNAQLAAEAAEAASDQGACIGAEPRDELGGVTRKAEDVRRRVGQRQLGSPGGLDDKCSLGPRTRILAEGHPLLWVERADDRLSAVLFDQPPCFGDHVFVSGDASDLELGRPPRDLGTVDAARGLLADESPATCETTTTARSAGSGPFASSLFRSVPST